MNIIVCLLASLLLNLYGVDWGLPSRDRTTLVFPDIGENKKVFRLLKQEIRGKIAALSIPPVDQYGMKAKKVLEFPPSRFPRDKVMQTLLSGYLLTSGEEKEYRVLAGLNSMAPASLDFNPHFFSYGGCFVYTVGLTVKMASLLGWVRSDADISTYFENPEELGRVYILGRIVVVLATTLSIFFLYLLGKNLYGKEAGVFAALAFGISPGIVASAHIMKPHLFGIPFILLFLLCILKLKERGSKSWYILSGLCLGLAVGSAIYLAIFFVHLLTCHLLSSAPRGIKGYFLSLKDPNLLFALGTMLSAFIITNPYYFIAWKEVCNEIGCITKQFTFALSLDSLSNFTFSFFWIIHGIGLSLLAGIGLFISLVKGRDLWFLPLLPLLYFLISSAFIGKGGASELSLALFLVPFTSLLAGIAAQELWSLQKRWIRILLWVVMGITFTHSLLYSFNFKQAESSSGTFYRAGQWINQTIPQGSSIGLMNLFTPATTPPFDFREFRITIYAPRELSSEKRYLSQYVISDRRIDDFLVPHYQLTQSFLPSWPLSTLRFTDHFTGANRPVFIYKKNQ
jgi:hypothetical protein